MKPAECDARPELFVLDVREDDEWGAGHIPGAHHIPLGQLCERSSELPAEKPLVAVCRSGARSAKATEHLRGLGFDVENLEGGTTAWAAAGLPLLTDTGKPGRVA
jgi:rhodanese-related sulfurtransferase